MKIFITYAMIAGSFCMMITGCYSKKKAMRQMTKAQAIHPDVVAGFCNNIYAPLDWVKDSVLFTMGNEVTVDSIVLYIDCDTVSPAMPKIVKVPCPAYKQRIDTLLIYKEKQVVNKAALVSLQAAYNELLGKYSSAKLKSKILLWVIIGLVLVMSCSWLMRRFL